MALTKRIFALCLVLVCIASLAITVSASSIPNGVHCYHGNDDANYKCYARITQSSDDYTIGAQITWQLSGSASVYRVDPVTTRGKEAYCPSYGLAGYKGQSFGYYTVDGVQVHKSTAWMDFSF